MIIGSESAFIRYVLASANWFQGYLVSSLLLWLSGHSLWTSNAYISPPWVTPLE